MTFESNVINTRHVIYILLFVFFLFLSIQCSQFVVLVTALIIINIYYGLSCGWNNSEFLCARVWGTSPSKMLISWLASPPHKNDYYFQLAKLIPVQNKIQVIYFVCIWGYAEKKSTLTKIWCLLIWSDFEKWIKLRTFQHPLYNILKF